MTEEQIKKYTYTKEEVNMLVQAAVAEAKEMDRVLMAKHYRNAPIISMILGLIKYKGSVILTTQTLLLIPI